MAANPIRHLIVVMMENRSFDHMLGFLKSPTYAINGLNGTEENLDTNNNPRRVTKDAQISGDLNPDPGHSFEDTAIQIYGSMPGSAPPSPSMSGFIKNYFSKTKSVSKSVRIMKCFSEKTVPIISRLAKEYCVCDNWFSSIPGPTLCNRVYAHAATSIGRVDTGPDWHQIPTTIYELLRQSNVSSRIYYNDFTVAMTFPNLMAAQQDYFGRFEDFVDDCRNNRLPAYSFLEPRYFSTDTPAFLPAEDQHPDHNVWAGEAFLRKVYEAVTSNDAVWQSSLLVITYDEHGGTYDHVPPPLTVNPDGKNCTDPPFDFTRLGVRVPAILISPYVERGEIDHTLYDHSSIVATARKMFLTNWQTTFLTERDRQASCFDGCITLAAPRTDKVNFSAPAHSVFHAMTAFPVHARDEAELRLSEFQKSQVAQAAVLEAALPESLRTGINAKKIRTERDAARFMQMVMDSVRRHAVAIAKSRARKVASKAAVAKKAASKAVVAKGAVARRGAKAKAAGRKAKGRSRGAAR